VCPVYDIVPEPSGAYDDARGEWQKIPHLNRPENTTASHPASGTIEADLAHRIGCTAIYIVYIIAGAKSPGEKQNGLATSGLT